MEQDREQTYGGQGHRGGGGMDWEFGRHLFSLALKITDIFSVSMVLSFPEYYINGIIQLIF